MARSSSWQDSFELIAGFALIAAVLLFLTPIRRLDGAEASVAR